MLTASMDHIAAGAGVTKAIVHRHAEGKLELFAAVVGRVRAQLREAAGDAGSMSLASLRRVLDVARDDPRRVPRVPGPCRRRTPQSPTWQCRCPMIPRPTSRPG